MPLDQPETQTQTPETQTETQTETPETQTETQTPDVVIPVEIEWE